MFGLFDPLPILRAEVDVSDLALRGVFGAAESGDFGALSLERRLKIGDGVCLESRASLERRLLDRDFPVLALLILVGERGTKSFGGTGGGGAVRSG